MFRSNKRQDWLSSFSVGNIRIFIILITHPYRTIPNINWPKWVMRREFDGPGDENPTDHYVRWCGHKGVAGVTRDDAEAVHRADRDSLDVPAVGCAGLRPSVRSA